MVQQKWKRPEREIMHSMISAASASDNKEAGHKRVNCVGLFPLGTGKDWI